MFAVRVEEDYIGLMGRHVAEGQSIIPGAPLIDIMTPEGVVETICSQGWGIVAHIEGGRLFSVNNNGERAEDDDEDDDEDGESGSARGGSGGSNAVFPKGSLICHIVSRMQDGVRKSGLHPRPAPSVRLRRMAGTSPG